MKSIHQTSVQLLIDQFSKQDVYIHLETTNGAYASHHDQSFFSASAYIRNAKISYEHGKITGDGPYRVGLKLDLGWVYADGLTHYEDQQDRLLLAGHNYEGKLAVCLEISRIPFE
ncbi:YojF family protein [Halalkalibacter urbisdiaboli]|uniref:YojF family protein n=1 Tax=Halalkalibacter urbisdiaboli TaxID=1960589 RepID=UPI000B444912|nr:YojF family protein [Halalkalibacter urbisdiaboli]